MDQRRRPARHAHRPNWNPITTTLETVEAACSHLTNNGRPVTFTAVVDHAGLSRTILYRNPQLRAVIEDHRNQSNDPHTLTGIAAEITHLRTGLEALADRIRNQEERPRHIEGRPTHRKAN